MNGNFLLLYGTQNNEDVKKRIQEAMISGRKRRKSKSES
jgi:hypothetical protein